MEGIRNILEIIGIPVDKILAFFKKALCLDTAAKINAAIKNMIDISMDLLIDKTSELKETSVEFLTNAVEEIDKWADIDEKSLSDISLPDLTAKNTNILGDMGISLDSHNMFFYDLMKNTVMDSISLPAITMSDSLETAIKTLLDDMREIAGDIERIPASLTYIAEEIEGLLQKFTAADFLAVAKKILGVVADEFLLISKSLLKLIFDVVIEGIRLIWQALNTNISIPFLSDVLSVFGIHEFSMVDLVIYPIASLTAMLDGAGKLFSGETIVAPEAMEMLSKVKSIDELKNGGVSYV
jgi:hypothetical protein